MNLNKIKEFENGKDLELNDFDRLESFESDNASLSDIYLNNLDNATNINMKLKSLTRMNKANANANSSMESAEKITKNIFDSTNTKLSMDIFNSINMGNLLFGFILLGFEEKVYFKIVAEFKLAKIKYIDVNLRILNLISGPKMIFFVNLNLFIDG